MEGRKYTALVEINMNEKVNKNDKITFGKYKRKTFNQVSQIDPYYIIWITENVKSIKLPKKFVDKVQRSITEKDNELQDAVAEYWRLNY
jgi:hypothetical protein